jgi:hypothetical protein
MGQGTRRPRLAVPATALTCEDDEGRLRATRSLVVDRGDRLDVGSVCERSFALGAKRR